MSEKKYGFKILDSWLVTGARIWIEKREGHIKFSKEEIRVEVIKMAAGDPIDSFDYHLNGVKLNSFEEIPA